MATKGASNHYGNARHGRQGHITTHTGFAWAKGFMPLMLLLLPIEWTDRIISLMFEEPGKP